MSSPIVVDLPHKLGKQEAKRRIQNGIGKLKDHIPGGAEATSSWDEDRMSLNVRAMGQEIDAKLDVMDAVVRMEVKLPAMLAFFGKQIEAVLRRQGTEMLEDKSKG
ncbi:MAG: hypothetical protein E6G94_05865 [Alphaproteobacteria bacterium]|nr:MAG: hypothetical protein E6G94_05865 [Alphaproteobacteria bacterium]